MFACPCNNKKKKKPTNPFSSLLYELCYYWVLFSEYKMLTRCIFLKYSFLWILLAVYFSAQVYVLVAWHMLFCLPWLLVGFFFCSVHMVLTGLIYVDWFSISYSHHAVLLLHRFYHYIGSTITSVLPLHRFYHYIGLGWNDYYCCKLYCCWTTLGKKKVYIFYCLSGSPSLLLKKKKWLRPYYDWIFLINLLSWELAMKDNIVSLFTH